MTSTTHKRAARIATLLAGYMRDNLTEAEHDELDEWVGASDKNMRLFEEITNEEKVVQALELINREKPIGYHYGFSRGFMKGVMVGMIVEIILMNLK